MAWSRTTVKHLEVKVGHGVGRVLRVSRLEGAQREVDLFLHGHREGSNVYVAARHMRSQGSTFSHK